jgi:hypothetical protein
MPLAFETVRRCLVAMDSFLRTAGLLFSTAPGSSGGGGGGGSGTGPGAALATRVQVTWCANGPYRTDTAVDGAWIAPTAMQISGVRLWREVAGTSGTTTLDLSANGTTLYTLQSNRPKVNASDGDDKAVTCIMPDVTLIAQGDVVTVDTDTKEAGRPMNWRLTLEGA